MLEQLVDAGLMRGTTVGIDATTLEANAALLQHPPILRRDTGEDGTAPDAAGRSVGHRDADPCRVGAV